MDSIKLLNKSYKPLYGLILSCLAGFSASVKANDFGNYPINHTQKLELIKQCSNGVHPEVMQAVIDVESSFNGFAIGVVKGNLSRQPNNLQDALQAVNALQAKGKNFSVGFAQVNKTNFKRYGLTGADIFHPCKNISAGSLILRSCYDGAIKKTSDTNQALKMAFSCYYSGNYRTGFTQDFPNQKPYVYKVWDKLLAIQGRRGEVQQQSIPLTNSMNSEQLAQFANDSLANKPNYNSVDSNLNESSPHVIEAKQVVFSWDVFKEFNGKSL